MEKKESKTCNKCERSTKMGKLVLCKNTEKLVCKDCCVKSLDGTIGKCIHWGFCWPSYYV